MIDCAYKFVPEILRPEDAFVTRLEHLFAVSRRIHGVSGWAKPKTARLFSGAIPEFCPMETGKYMDSGM